MHHWNPNSIIHNDNKNEHEFRVLLRKLPTDAALGSVDLLHFSWIIVEF